MSKAWRPSSWGLKIIDVLFIVILIAILIKFFAPDTGLANAIHVFCGWLAIGITNIANLLARFLTWL